MHDEFDKSVTFITPKETPPVSIGKMKSVELLIPTNTGIIRIVRDIDTGKETKTIVDITDDMCNPINRDEMIKEICQSIVNGL